MGCRVIILRPSRTTIFGVPERRSLGGLALGSASTRLSVGTLPTQVVTMMNVPPSGTPICMSGADGIPYVVPSWKRM